MIRYKIIGLQNEEQARRVEQRFQEALDCLNIEIDRDHQTIRLPKTTDPHTISVISSFEQISLVDETDYQTNHRDHDGFHHAHHHHGFDRGWIAQKNIFFVFLLNLFYSIGEFIFGTLFKSRALLTDAIHDFGDVLSIGMAWIFQKISNRRADEIYSYGYRRFSLLGAIITSIILIVGSVLVIVDSAPLMFKPEVVDAQGVLWVALGAILINGFSVWRLRQGQSANEKLLNLHLLEDLFGWIAVLVMSLVLHFTDWYILDPILSLIIAGWILYRTIPEFLRISKIFLQAVPGEINACELRESILRLPNVHAISHFHIWSTDGEQHMMTVTVTTASPDVTEHEAIKQQIRQIVTKHHISHVTIEVLYDPKRIIKDSILCEG